MNVKIMRTEDLGYTPGGVLIQPKVKSLPTGCRQVEWIAKKPEELFEISYGRREFFRADKLMRSVGIDPVASFRMTKGKTTVCAESGKFIIPKSMLKKLPEADRKRAVKFIPPAEVVYSPPTLFHFMEEKYVERFLKTGKIRLTTFDRCRKLEDDSRRDRGEGWGTFVARGKNFTVEAAVGVGSNPFMFCSSLSYKARHKKSDGCLVIKDSVGFMMAIAGELRRKGAYLRRVLYGPCVYGNRLMVQNFSSNEAVVERIQNGLKERCFDADAVSDLAAQIGGVQPYFNKPPQYAPEHEYRLVWEPLDPNKKKQYIDVTVPHWKRFCEKLILRRTKEGQR